jgi:hypothetical protein
MKINNRAKNVLFICIAKIGKRIWLSFSEYQLHRLK